MASDSDKVTRLLLEWGDGNQQALEALVPLIYKELRNLAHNFLYRERPGHTLQTTALVHEAYLKLIDQNDARWQNRAHFFAIAAQAMRRILIARYEAVVLYASLDSDTKPIRATSKAALLKARSSYQQSLDTLGSLQERRVFVSGLAKRLEEVSQKLSACETALAKLKS
ncbi:MAG: hypothetical protein AUJ04_03405 [Acidobacteria bacterium 13_1_40CM_3_55_6]|nr:MAG: hypothetical protein AUJ04_03405 [Acidobacteria bacterium 13_1_40CM_3_55_6]